MKLIYNLLVVFIFCSCLLYSQEPVKTNKISMSVGLSPIVTPSSKEVKINEKIYLILITGLDYSRIKWHWGSTIVDTNSDNSVTFTEFGRFKPYVDDIPLHDSYDIIVKP